MRNKDILWDLPDNTYPAVQCCLLMDLRDELKLIRDCTRRSTAVLECRNAASIPGILRKIERHLRTPSVEARRRRAIRGVRRARRRVL